MGEPGPFLGHKGLGKVGSEGRCPPALGGRGGVGGRCAPWGPSPPPRWPVSGRPGHRVELLVTERVGMEAWLPRCWAFLPLSGKRGSRPIGPGSLPKGLHAWILHLSRWAGEEVPVQGANSGLSPSASCRVEVSRLTGSSEAEPCPPGRSLEGGLPGEPPAHPKASEEQLSPAPPSRCPGSPGLVGL